MNEIDVLKGLPGRRETVPPRVDVTGATLAAIARGRRRAVDPVLVALPIVSAAATAGIVAAAVQVWMTFQDPLNDLMESMMMVMQ